jgi:Short-chain dehydrogenases of various substrate specificities
MSWGRCVQDYVIHEVRADWILQTVVITGGSDGMGKAVALELSAKGANVVVVARTVSKLVTAIDEMKVGHPSIIN